MVKDQGPKGWIGVDLDGTLAYYDGWTKWNQFGAPIPLMVDRVRRWLSEGKDVRIFTARVQPDYFPSVSTCYKSGETFTNDDMIKAIQDYCEVTVGRRLQVTCVKDLHMIELWDDRAVGVEVNTGRTLADAAVAEAQALRGAP